MHGNVWEFCDSDRPRRTDSRVLRGACFGEGGARCRAASRDFFRSESDTNRYENLGLRVCFRPR
jgi:formylglycine-generating enzyme required for sulfatase activity